MGENGGGENDYSIRLNSERRCADGIKRKKNNQWKMYVLGFACWACESGTQSKNTATAAGMCLPWNRKERAHCCSSYIRSILARHRLTDTYARIRMVYIIHIRIRLMEMSRLFLNTHRCQQLVLMTFLLCIEFLAMRSYSMCPWEIRERAIVYSSVARC